MQVKLICLRYSVPRSLAMSEPPLETGGQANSSGRSGYRSRRGNRNSEQQGGSRWVPTDVARGREVVAEGQPSQGERKKSPKGKGKGKGKGKKSKGKSGSGDGAPHSSAEQEMPPETSQKSHPSPPRRRYGSSTGTVAERLADQLSRGSYDCMICLTKVKPSHHIWSCDQCWAAFHLKCIRSWVRRCNTSDGPEFEWACPGCRYHRVDRLPDYTCFCKKLPEPELNPHWLAHSCGEVCERTRGCPHPCPELCHPGPCPRCTAVGGPGSCHCGQEVTETTRCGDPKKWSCGQPCGQTLSCGQHICKARCHEGRCPPCSETSLESCFCGKTEEHRLCGQTAFSCRRPCGRALECQEHFCERECHAGECGLCPKDPKTWGDRCACGKTSNCSSESVRPRLVKFVGQRRRCSQPLALCNQFCGRRHERCSHTCEAKCHEGPCDVCKVKVQRDCRCGRTRREAVCSEGADMLCHHVCRTKKTCGNHKCEVVCCEGFNNRNHEAHMCLQVCGRPLPCGNHVCEEFCHLGNCPPCRVVLHEPLYCACGKNSVEPPVFCGTAPPECDEPCAQLMECGHECPAKCHEGPHPLCYEPVSRLCLGGHKQLFNTPCHVGSISCGQPCGKPLPCGHSCSSQCHAGECKPCSSPCGARRVHCSHTCQADCHPGSQCEDTPCKWKIKQACPCGRRVEERLCGAFSGLPRPQTSQRFGCLPSCERRSIDTAIPGEAVKYTADLFQLAVHHRRYLEMLEDTFMEGILDLGAKGAGRPGSNVKTLPPCDASRRLLAVEYARLHWRIKTSTRPDPVEGWFVVQVVPGSQSRPPRPLLSEIAAASSTAVSSYLLPTLSSQPCLRFMGLKSLDEVYDLVGLEGLLGVRPGNSSSEAIAFVERGATGASLFRRLTGQEPKGASEAPLRSTNAWGQGSSTRHVRVSLEQTLTTGPRPEKRLANAKAAPVDAWDTKTGDQEEEDEVPDNWEDM